MGTSGMVRNRTPRPGATAAGGGTGDAQDVVGGAMLAWLGHPVTLLAIGVMAVNDHMLKGVAPGLVTGKLSDVAGLMIAPPLLAGLLAVVVPPVLRRAGERVAAVAMAVTGLGFVLVKTTGTGAWLASAVWTAVAGPSQVLPDPTDLVALPALGVAWWLWGRARARPLSAPIVRLVRLAVVLPAAVLVVAATSYERQPNATWVERWRELVVVRVDGAYADVVATSDGGVTWRRLDPDVYQKLSAAPGEYTEPKKSACVPTDPAVCYRVVPLKLRVEQSADGGATWTVAWEVSDAQVQVLRGKLRSGAELWSDLLIVVPARNGGHMVFVTNRSDGVLVRDTSGVWRRLGFPATEADGSNAPAVPLAAALPTLAREAPLASPPR